MPCRGLIRATLHMVNREFQELANDFETLGLLPAGSDKDQVVPALSSVFEKALAGGVSNMSFGTLSGDLGKTMYQFKFRIPSYYTLLVRSLSVLEVGLSHFLPIWFCTHSTRSRLRLSVLKARA